jgi:hypothetical protein
MDNHNTTNTSPNDSDGVKAPKRGRQSSSEKSAQLAGEVLMSPPQKKPPVVVKGMEVCVLD